MKYDCLTESFSKCLKSISDLFLNDKYLLSYFSPFYLIEKEVV